ncbi:MAG: hypothetical protein Q6363_009465, partial [Candidatus Njordarchaeota archaeon]
YIILNLETQEKMIATPQIFLETKDGLEYLLNPTFIIIDEFHDEIKRRVKNLLKYKSGLYNLALDLYETQTYQQNTLIRVLDLYLLDKGLTAILHHKGAVYLVDYKRLKKVIENEYNCLCIKGQKCPCQLFIHQGSCVCGTFVKLDFIENPDEYKMIEYEQFLYNLIKNKFNCQKANKKCDLNCRSCPIAEVVKQFDAGV